MSRQIPQLTTWLLVVLLPIQACASMIDGAWRPAHYHRHHIGQGPVVVADGRHTLQPNDVLVYLDAEDATTAAQRHQASGSHHHARGDSDVVYVASGDGDPATGMIGRQNFDVVWTLVPAWTVSLLTLDTIAPHADLLRARPSPCYGPPEHPPR